MNKYENKPYVYKLTNTVTGQFYYGYRTANKLKADLDIGIEYKTSSKVIKDIGFSQFSYEIISECYNEDRDIASSEAYWIEQDLIRINFEDLLCLNRNYVDRLSGNKAFRRTGKHTELTKNKMSKSRIGNTSEYQKERIREANRARVSNRPEGWVVHNKGKSHSEESINKMKRKRSPETCEKIGNSKRGTKRSEETLVKLRELYATEEYKLKRKSMFTEEVREKISNSRSKYFDLVSPDGIRYQGRNLSKFCSEHGLGSDSMYNLCAGITQRHKGWSGRYVRISEEDD